MFYSALFGALMCGLSLIIMCLVMTSIAYVLGWLSTPSLPFEIDEHDPSFAAYAKPVVTQSLSNPLPDIVELDPDAARIASLKEVIRKKEYKTLRPSSPQPTTPTLSVGSELFIIPTNQQINKQ
jgi:hypothetical protein